MQYNILPERWLNYKPFNRTISRFLPFKVPLKEELIHDLSEHQRFGWKRFLRQLSEENVKLGLVIDLCNTNRYYHRSELNESRYPIIHYKLECKGHDDIPSSEVFLEFAAQVKQFLRQASDDLFIGVHCTHGVNRTGFLICKYLILYDGIDPAIAVGNFEQSRGHNFDKKFYVDYLLGLNSENRETPPRDLMRLDFSVKKYDLAEQYSYRYPNRSRPYRGNSNGGGFRGRGSERRDDYRPREPEYRREAPQHHYSNHESERRPGGDRSYAQRRHSPETHRGSEEHGHREHQDRRDPYYSKGDRREQYPLYEERRQYRSPERRDDSGRFRPGYSRPRPRGFLGPFRARGRGFMPGPDRGRRVSPRGGYHDNSYTRKRANDSYGEDNYRRDHSRDQIRPEYENLPSKRTRNEDSYSSSKSQSYYEDKRSSYLAQRSPRRSPNGSSNRVYLRPRDDSPVSNSYNRPLSDVHFKSRDLPQRERTPERYRTPPRRNTPPPVKYDFSQEQKEWHDDRRVRDATPNSRYRNSPPQRRSVEMRPVAEDRYDSRQYSNPTYQADPQRNISDYRPSTNRRTSPEGSYHSRNSNRNYVTETRTSENPEYRDFKKSVAPEYGSFVSTTNRSGEFDNRELKRGRESRSNERLVSEIDRRADDESPIRSKVLRASRSPEIDRRRSLEQSSAKIAQQVVYRTERTASGIEFSIPSAKEEVQTEDDSRSRTRTRSRLSEEGSTMQSRSRGASPVSDSRSRQRSRTPYDQNTGVGFRDTRDRDSVSEENTRVKYVPRREDDFDRNRSRGYSRSYSRDYSRGAPRGRRLITSRGIGTRGRSSYNPAVRRARGLVSLSARMRGGRISGPGRFPTRGNSFRGLISSTRSRGFATRSRGPPGGFRGASRGGFRSRRG
ncbi:uncharacterized protein LOC142351979 [Convolutriloba macropyga]|uniref:uncharacterized protein LOC142351979 n=1 Tax=Convolutriloba macropyga TaxID=536237 RepID=UPI003F524EFE